MEQNSPDRRSQHCRDLRLSHHVLPAMIGRGHGAILNIGSGAGYAAMANAAVYTASKHFVPYLASPLMRFNLPRSWGSFEPSSRTSSLAGTSEPCPPALCAGAKELLDRWFRLRTIVLSVCKYPGTQQQPFGLLHVESMERHCLYETLGSPAFLPIQLCFQVLVRDLENV